MNIHQILSHVLRYAEIKQHDVLWGSLVPVDDNIRQRKMNQQPYNIVVGDAFAMVCNFSINILRVLFVALNTALISNLEGYQRVYNFFFSSLQRTNFNTNYEAFCGKLWFEYGGSCTIFESYWFISGLNQFWKLSFWIFL